MASPLPFPDQLRYTEAEDAGFARALACLWPGEGIRLISQDPDHLNRLDLPSDEPAAITVAYRLVDGTVLNAEGQQTEHEWVQSFGVHPERYAWEHVALEPLAPTDPLVVWLVAKGWDQALPQAAQGGLSRQRQAVFSAARKALNAESFYAHREWLETHKAQLAAAQLSEALAATASPRVRKPRL